MTGNMVQSWPCVRAHDCLWHYIFAGHPQVAFLYHLHSHFLISMSCARGHAHTCARTHTFPHNGFRKSENLWSEQKCCFIHGALLDLELSDRSQHLCTCMNTDTKKKGTRSSVKNPQFLLYLNAAVHKMRITGAVNNHIC